MKIYWTQGSIPELKQISPAERRKMWKNCSRRAYRHWQTWLAWGAYVFFVYAGIVASNVIFGRMSGISTMTFPDFVQAVIPRVTVLVICAGIGLLIVDQVITAFARPYLQAYRRDGQAPIH
jgi:hypothetical protein